MPCRATQDGQVMVESSGKMCPTGEGNDKPLKYSCLDKPMNNMKRQKDMTPEDESPRSVGAQYAPERMKRLGQNGNNIWLWMFLMVKVNLML